MSALAAADGLRWLIVAQGETRVSDQTDVVMTTVLGSCIAACFFDPVAQVGGINHYLLATGSADDDAARQRYGVYGMETLIGAMLALGATRSRLKARIFGGATIHTDFHEIGEANIACARQFLHDHRIPLAGEDVGGAGARHVEFRAALGLTRCRMTSELSPTPPA